MSINLHTKYGDKLANYYNTESFLAGKTNNEWEFSGVRTVRIPSIVTQPLSDYDRTAASDRYGTPSELQDTIQECTITQDKSFSIVIDKGNNTEQHAVKRAGEVMQLQIREQVVPLTDKYALERWARNAGKVVGLSAAPSVDTIVGVLVDIETHFDEHFVPLDNRFVALPNVSVGYLRQALTSDIAVDRLLLKGIVGKFGTMNIIGMPASWFPTDVYLIAWQLRSALLPQKLRDNVLHIDPPGVSGHRLEGRYNFDAFVLGAAAQGMYVACAAAYKTATPTLTKGATTSTLASTTNGGTVTIKYTLDGSDPRYSDSALTYSGAFSNPVAGTLLKAAAFFEADGHYFYGSDLLEHICV